MCDCSLPVPQIYSYTFQLLQSIGNKLAYAVSQIKLITYMCHPAGADTGGGAMGALVFS